MSKLQPEKRVVVEYSGSRQARQKMFEAQTIAKMNLFKMKTTGVRAIDTIENFGQHKSLNSQCYLYLGAGEKRYGIVNGKDVIYTKSSDTPIRGLVPIGIGQPTDRLVESVQKEQPEEKTKIRTVIQIDHENNRVKVIRK